MPFVSQKEIDGKIYTAYRDVDFDDVIKKPKGVKEWIECDGKKKKCVLKQVWPFNDKITELWQ